MTTEITVYEVDTSKVFVNEKEVYKNNDGNWECREELSPAETRALRKHLIAIGEQYG
ncbi:MAG: hypothetical protein AAF717_00180 [Bacteroidota bacterium]